MKFAGQSQSFRAPGGEQDLEAFARRGRAEFARNAVSSLDDQQRGIVSLQVSRLSGLFHWELSQRSLQSSAGLLDMELSPLDTPDTAMARCRPGSRE